MDVFRDGQMRIALSSTKGTAIYSEGAMATTSTASSFAYRVVEMKDIIILLFDVEALLYVWNKLIKAFDSLILAVFSFGTEIIEIAFKIIFLF